jgi:hypothetical protein
MELSEPSFKQFLDQNRNMQQQLSTKMFTFFLFIIVNRNFTSKQRLLCLTVCPEFKQCTIIVAFWIVSIHRGWYSIVGQEITGLNIFIVFLRHNDLGI